MRNASRRKVRCAWVGAVGASLCVAGAVESAGAAPISITRTTAFEADQANDGSYANATGKTQAGFDAQAGNTQTSPILQLGYERGLGSIEGNNFGDPEGQGGQSVVFYLKLPQLAPGQSINAAHFNVSLLHDNFQPPNFHISPRFSADLYGVGFVRDPNDFSNPANGTGSFFYSGNAIDNRNAAGTNKPVQLLQRNFFTLRDPTFSSNHDNVPTPGNQDFHFPDVAYVDSTTGYNGRVFQNGSSAATPVNTSTFTGSLPKGTTGPNGTGNVDPDGGGDAALLSYVQGLYADPNFVNDGNSYLALRLNPDYASNQNTPAYAAQGLNFSAGRGTSRYILPSNLTDFSTGFYAGADPGTLTLDVVPEPTSPGLLAVGAAGLLARRRRR